MAGFDKTVPSVDVAVIGAGPAGCEAAIAAARAGARCLCLTINLDTVGFPPANPVIAAGDDPRLALLEEMRPQGGVLPELLADTTIARTLENGLLIADRRRLGLAYKERLERSDGVQPRQTLVTAVTPRAGGWRLATKLGEEFLAAKVIIATGTFLEGEVDAGGQLHPGGRLGEIPANALAVSLLGLGLRLVTISATNMPRLDAKTLPGDGDLSAAGDYLLLPDGDQLDERYLFGPHIRGNLERQTASVRRLEGMDDAWMTRPSWSLQSLALAAGQLGADMECLSHSGLFFAGRSSGCCNYTEAAATGLLAGLAAAGAAGSWLTTNNNIMSKLTERVASSETRPVTIRDVEHGC